MYRQIFFIGAVVVGVCLGIRLTEVRSPDRC